MLAVVVQLPSLARSLLLSSLAYTAQLPSTRMGSQLPECGSVAFLCKGLVVVQGQAPSLTKLPLSAKLPSLVRACYRMGPITLLGEGLVNILLGKGLVVL